MSIRFTGTRRTNWNDEVLHDAAIWSNTEDFEVFFSEKYSIVGVSRHVGEDIA
ncbi:MAG: hypothetical protein RL717_1598, partial [Pseudomonadota bacterium]